MSRVFSLLMPYPPSANRLVRHTRSGHYPSKPYTGWKVEAEGIDIDIVASAPIAAGT